MSWILALAGKLISSPTVSGILIPVLSRALTDFFQRAANRVEESAAIRAAKAAKTAEELRLASKKLSDASRR
jgi:hypothetical protein